MLTSYKFIYANKAIVLEDRAPIKSFDFNLHQ